MFLIVGLGNPGKRYENTRHNVGFKTVDAIAKNLSISIEKVKFKGLLGEAHYAGKKVLLLKPYTYMNLSGQSVKDAVDFYKIPLQNLIVIYDDMDLPMAKLRIRPEGSSAGHNGVKSIIYQLGSKEFCRVKIGIEKPPEPVSTTAHVLGRFGIREQEKIDLTIKAAADASLMIVKEGLDEAMNKYNNFMP